VHPASTAGQGDVHSIVHHDAGGRVLRQRNNVGYERLEFGVGKVALTNLEDVDARGNRVACLP
jgi:hypothetical protein